MAASPLPSRWQRTLGSYVQPAMVAGLIAFWWLAPVGWVKWQWTVAVVSMVITALILGMELIAERHASWRMNRTEFATDTFYLLLDTFAIGWFTEKLADDPLGALKQHWGITTLWAQHLPFVGQVALVIFLVEFGQYWMHRLMHNHPLFWSVHAPHHHITQLNAMKGEVGNPIELFLISLSVVALFDLSPAAEFCAFNILGVVSTFAHANVRWEPPRWYAFFFVTIRNHSLHHSVPYEDTRCNYANSLIMIDRVLGTFRDGEAELVGQDQRRRLSVWEQFVFPLRMLRDAVKARRTEVAL